jgi:hypothetical protein
VSTDHDAMQISEGELISLTKDLDEAHHATFPAMQGAISELSTKLRDIRGDGLSRRNFLIAGTALGGTIALAACGSSGSSSSSSTMGSSTTTAKKMGSGNVDLAVAGLAAGLENLAVQTYQAALDAAAANKLGDVPPAVAAFAKTAMAQHADHAGAWNSVLTGAGKPAVTGVDITVNVAVVKPGFSKVKNVGDLAKFALALEDVAAATYLNGIQNALTLTAAIKIAASIQPVEMQHSAILNLLLGKYPVPDSFAKVDGARPPSDKIG